MKYKVLYYVNQFFGQIGGEEEASMEPVYKKEKIGPALAFDNFLKGEGEVIGTLICGDNYFNEHNEKALEYIRNIIKEEKPDIVIAGPAFNAGRYGMACSGVAELVSTEFDLPVVTGMYEENPGLESSRTKAIVVKTSNAAGGMKTALPTMAQITRKMMQGETLGLPEEEGYFAQGKRLTVFSDKRGSQRAVEMLLARLNNEDFTTELPMSTFDRVDPAPAIKDMKNATIALVTSGGMVPVGNPERLQSASAQKWTKYDISQFDSLKEADFCTIHGGFDPVYANDRPDRVAPLDLLMEYKQDGEIKDVFKYFYSTTGTGTSVGNSVKFGQEIGKELSDAKVDGVIVTST